MVNTRILMIHCDFEKGAIKAFKLHFQGVKILGCHFHFTSAIHKKVVDHVHIVAKRLFQNLLPGSEC